MKKLALIGLVLIFNVLGELGVSIESVGLEGKGFYKGSGPFDGLSWLPGASFGLWFVGTVAGAWLLTRFGKYSPGEEPVPDDVPEARLEGGA